MTDAQVKIENTEMRHSARIDHTAPIRIKDIVSGNLHKAKMLNYSSEGLYFESDSLLNPGMKIYLGIKNSPFAAQPDLLEYRRAEILWRKKRKESYYRFGYGVKLLGEGMAPVQTPPKAPADKELRRHPRKKCQQVTRFSTDEATFDGEIKNVSLSGVFISSPEALTVDQQLTLSVPGKQGKALRMSGKVVWTNQEGCGIQIQRTEKIQG
ncbi:MAG: PilZ domain-containing protein [Desulfosarcinaceae bacterium]|nr:PilZ domain-containing protein [Desulfosarcinaceae bacterium]